MCCEKPKTLSRVYYINNFLLQNIKTIYRLRKIGFYISDGKSVYSYAVSIAKDHTHTIEEQVKSFYDTCEKLLNTEEKLITDKKCFKIVSDRLEVCYCIEAWKKRADTIAYIEDGQVKVELLHRMSCEQAAYIFKQHRVEPFELLNTLETLEKYKNPADKYAALAKMPILLKGIHSRGG